MQPCAPVILPDPPAAPEPLGLIAGSGSLPRLVAEGMIASGHTVRGVGFINQYDPALRDICESFMDVGPLRLGEWGRKLNTLGVRYAVMVGRIDKARIMHSWVTILRNRPDVRTTRLWIQNARDRRSHNILRTVADELAKDGVQLIDSTTHITDHLASVGMMTETKPSARQQADIDLAWPILQRLLALDVGQAITVRGGDTIAVEAVEGTDRMIVRSGELCRAGGWTLLKGARANHDRRADVPTIGPDTLRNMHAHGGGCLALAAGDVIIIDKPETLALADELGISVLGLVNTPAVATAAVAGVESRGVEPSGTGVEQASV